MVRKSIQLVSGVNTALVVGFTDKIKLEVTDAKVQACIFVPKKDLIEFFEESLRLIKK